jgi:hypothetical protein
MLFKLLKFVLFLNIFLITYISPIYTQNVINRSKPMNLIFLIDQSGSMEFTGKNLMQPVRTGIREAISGNLQINDEIVLVGGNDNPNIIYHKRITNQNDIQEILNKIDNIRAIKDCATDMTAWMEFVSKEVDPIFQSDDVADREKTILYVITDGENLPQPTSKYATKDNSFHPAMNGFVSEILYKKWQINVIGVGFKTDARSLSESLQAAVYEISENNTKDELRKIISQALKNNIQISNSTVEYLFRRGSSNEIKLNVTGGWDYGELDIQEAYITFPASVQNRIPLSYTEGKISLAPSGTRKISLNFNLPIDNNIDGSHEGLIELVFKDGTTAEPKQFWIKARTEHWFIKYIPHVSTIVGITLFLLLLFYLYIKSDLYVVISVDGDQVEIVKFDNGKSYTLTESNGVPGSLTVRKKNQTLLVSACDFDEFEILLRGKTYNSSNIKGLNIYNNEVSVNDTRIKFKSTTSKKYKKFIEEKKQQEEDDNS